MNETIKLILSLSLSGSILAVLIFVFKPLMKHRLSKSIQYYIWIVVLIRLILPFSFEDSIMNKLFFREETIRTIDTESTVLPVDGINNDTINSDVLPGTQEKAGNDAYAGSSIYNDVDYSKYFIDLFNQYALYLWALGVIIALAASLMGYARFSKYIKQANVPATDEENRILFSLSNNRHNVRLVRNRFVNTPMLLGVVRPYIIIPDIAFDEKQLKNILLHELSHLRRFDIPIKWLTLISTSIHWFNPLMYFVKREINHACELACDEAVIKNLNATEKQVYGDTLISVVAEHKYPARVLQATMCEEKRSLKERLLAIMNYNKKSKLIIAFSGVLLGAIILCALFLGAGIGTGKDTPPNLYVIAEQNETKLALIGTYSWSYRGRHIQADSDHPANFKYGAENIVSVLGKQQLIIRAQKFKLKQQPIFRAQKLKLDKKYDFTLEQISVYKDDKPIEVELVEPRYINGDLYIQAPPEAGEYIYVLELNFKGRGTVSYGFVVRVDMMEYDLNEISKHKTPYVGNHVKVGAIAGRLPAPDKYFRQQYTSMKTKEKPYKLTVYYEAAIESKYEGEWPIVTPDSAIETNSRINALVIFCMIDNVDEVTFAFRDSQSDGKLDESKYNTIFTFHRAFFEEKYGDLTVLGENLDLLKDILEGKEPSTNGSISIGGRDLDKDLTIGAQVSELTDDEIDAARAVVEEYFRAVAAKEDKAILKTLTPVHNHPNVVLHGEEIRTLLSVDYNINDPMRESYIKHGRGSVNGTKKENVIVFKVSFNVKYPKGITGSFNEGDYTNWSMILIRDSKTSPWLIDDQGY